MFTSRVHDVLPELEAFTRAVRERRPGSGTWCEAWTVRDILIHQSGNAEELGRVLAAHLAGEPVATRDFDREIPYRALSESELWSAFARRVERLVEIADTAERELPPDTVVMWTGRRVTVPFFAEHLREEMILHRWDVTGDDSTAREALDTPWMTRHTVTLVGQPLLVKGSQGLGLGPDARVEGRLRTPGTDDVLISADANGTAIGFAAPEGPATIESDAATRTLLLWGRRPADPSRWHSDAGPEALRAIRTLLSGY